MTDQQQTPDVDPARAGVAIETEDLTTPELAQHELSTVTELDESMPLTDQAADPDA